MALNKVGYDKSYFKSHQETSKIFKKKNKKEFIKSHRKEDPKDYRKGTTVPLSYPVKAKKYLSSFLSAWLLHSSCFHPAYGMTDEDWEQHNWSSFFTKNQNNVSLGSRILIRLDERSLVKASRVSQGWKALVHKTQDERYRLHSQGKAPLFKAILEAVGAEADEVTRAWHTLNLLMESSDFQGQASTLIKQKLAKIKPRLLQPESLILRDEVDDFLECKTPHKNHPALSSLVQVIKDLEEMEQAPQFKQLKSENLKVFIALKALYEQYLKNLLDPEAKKVPLLRPKVILSGEGMMGLNPFEISSYRISQEMALSLLSKDRYGLFLKHNALGSHAVKKQGEVHFKGNTTSTGLPVGRESAAYWFAQVLFGESLTPTALLTLNEVEIKTPQEQTQARCDYAIVQATGKTSSEFFKDYPQHQKAFTQENPHHFLQASLSVTGLSLEDFMKGAESGNYHYEDLDLNSFSELIFMSLLTNPSDGTPGNFMVRTNQGKPYAIIGIDNDMAFGPALILTKRGKDKAKQGIFKPSLEVKNVLYCLPLMDQPLSGEIRDKILSTSPELFLLRWLERLKVQQNLYDKLKERGYTKEEKHVSYLNESTYVEELHLPLCFPAGLLTRLVEDFTKLQGKIKSRSSITHTQLFSFFQPLIHRFYTALQRKYPTPLAAYHYIHNSNFENIDLEDILQPHQEEVLSSGQTLDQALREVSLQGQAQAQSKAQTLSQSAQEIWKNLDLNAQSRITPFLELAAIPFSSCFQDNPTFHPSWLQQNLLFRALKERASYRGLDFLLNTLKLKADVRDHKTQQNVLHCAIQKKPSLPHYSSSILTLLLDSLPVEEQPNLLKGLDSSGLSPLDYAMEGDEIPSFLALIARGAKTCSASLALKFYKRMVRENTKNSTSLHPAFRKLMALNPVVEWVVSLEELLPPVVSKKGYQGQTLTSSTYGERHLPENVKSQIIDKKGEFILVSNTGNHPVAYAQLKGSLKTHGLYFKFYPALPGLEEAVGRFTRQLLRFGAPYTDLVKWGEGVNTFPCLISQEIPGDTLQKVLETKPHLLNDLDEEDISGMIIAAMLINPEDGKPDNYIVTPHPIKQNKYRLVGIDNDQAFVPAIVKETPDKVLFTGKILPIAQVKTILYCLDQMKNPVPPAIRTTIINTHPDRFLEEWLRDLKRVNNEQCGLFSSFEQAKAFKTHESFIGVPFQEGAVRHMYEKFVHMRDLVTGNSMLTHIDLLNKLEPRLAKRYEITLNKNISVKEKFEQVDRPFYEVKPNAQKGESHTTVTRSGNILQSMGIPLQEKIFDAIRLGKESCPVQALEELETIRREKNEDTLKSLALRVADINFLKTLNLETSRVLFLKELDKQKKILTPQEQIAILDYLTQQKGIRELPLPNFSAMDDEIFQKIPFEHLTKVDLRRCNKISYVSLVHLSQKSLALEALNLSYNSQLREIGDIGTFRDAPLFFKELRFLNLKRCTSLSKLLIQAPKLYYLNIERCALLNDQMLDGVIEQSPHLQKLVVEGCPLVGEKELRKKYPNFPVNYLNLNNKDPIYKILESKGSELKFGEKKIDTSSQGLMVFGKALKINVHLFDLTTLELYGNNIGETGAKALGNANLLGLVSLNLGANNIGEEGVKALSLSNLTVLTKLNLRDNEIGAEGVKTLVSGNLKGLTSLKLSWNDIGELGAKALGLGNLFNLKKLDLGSNKIGDEGIKALGLGNLTSLTKLDLSHNKIGVEGAYALANGNLKGLTLLDLGGNFIGDEGLKALASSNLKGLTKLDLGSNYIGEIGTKALANGNLSALTSLNLSYNNIGDEGAKALGLGNLTSLTTLYLIDNNIWGTGAKALASSNLKGLTELDLRDNNIRETGAKALANGNLTGFISLYLSGNNIGNEGRQALKAKFGDKASF